MNQHLAFGFKNKKVAFNLQNMYIIYSYTISNIFCQTLSIYEVVLKLVLLPLSTQIPADLKTSSPMLDALRNAFHIDVPSHEKILVKLQKVLNKDNVRK